MYLRTRLQDPKHFRLLLATESFSCALRICIAPVPRSKSGAPFPKAQDGCFSMDIQTGVPWALKEAVTGNDTARLAL